MSLALVWLASLEQHDVRSLVHLQHVSAVSLSVLCNVIKKYYKNNMQ